jgi:hypothetical protein
LNNADTTTFGVRATWARKAILRKPCLKLDIRLNQASGSYGPFSCPAKPQT